MIEPTSRRYLPVPLHGPPGRLELRPGHPLARTRPPDPYGVVGTRSDYLVTNEGVVDLKSE